VSGTTRFLATSKACCRCSHPSLGSPLTLSLSPPAGRGNAAAAPDKKPEAGPRLSVPEFGFERHTALPLPACGERAGVSGGRVVRREPVACERDCERRRSSGTIRQERMGGSDAERQSLGRQLGGGAGAGGRRRRVQQPHLAHEPAPVA